MKTGIATVSLSGNFSEKLEAIAAAGFDGIEIFEQDFIADTASPKEIGERIRAMGLEIMLFQPFRDFECLPDDLRKRAFERAERKFDVMGELGTDLVLVCSTVHPASLGGIDRAADDFAELGERAAKRGIRVGYEALAWGRHINDHRDAWEVVRRADHANIGLILDSFHTLSRGIDPQSIRAIPGDKIFFVQLADAPKIDVDLLYWSRHFRNMPGEGDLPVTGFMQAIAATGYNGPISLEIFNDQFRGGPSRRIAQDGHRSLVALMDDVRRAEPTTAAGATKLPPRGAVNGVSFIEYAAQNPERDQLCALLSSMGFENVGRHKSKQVDVWQQGDIRIVVNSEQDGFAHSAWLVRGTCVCDIGLDVPDANDAVVRAEAMDAHVFSQSAGPGELEIPAIRGIGRSLIHFLDSSSALGDVWNVEFDATGSASAGAGLMRVDHVAETMSYDQMLSWSLFYSTLFDMKKTPMFDVIDPDGLVRSQALATPSRSFRVTLNGAETHKTLAGNFLAGSFGAGVQHIAFATADIFQSAETMAKRGFEPLPMPKNYYDDLDARFALGSEKIAKMRQFNILYDEDTSGGFYQFYSKPFGDGQFFEIVQRIDGYDGYGGPNAPFRIAAQKRLMAPKGMPKA